MKRKISDKEIKEKLLEIFDKAGRSPLSIREVTIKLKEAYDINLNPKLAKEYLFKLKKENKIE